MDSFNDTYRGKKVFVTGHTGFKGAWLLQTLDLLGANVKGYALSPYTDNDLFNIIQGETICDSVIGDIRDRQKLTDEVKRFQPDFIFHLAAQPLVRLSYNMPAETFDVNAIGTANLLDAVRELDKKVQVVLVTTDKVYHNQEWETPYKETDRLGGYDPYSASKACAELVIDSYRSSFFNRDAYAKHEKAIAVARAGNVIGGGDWSEARLMPDVARALGRNEEIPVRNPMAVRPWQHVLESLSGYLKLGEHLAKDPLLFSEAYNFGPEEDDALPVKQMVDLAIRHWGSGSYHIIHDTNAVHEAGLLKLDITKAKTQLGWSPKLHAAEAVKYTIDWYRTFFFSPELLPELTKTQVTSFLS